MVSNNVVHDVQLELLVNKAVSCKLDNRGLNKMDAIIENAGEESRLTRQRDVDIPKPQYFDEDFAMRLARLASSAGLSYFLGIRVLPRSHEIVITAERNHPLTMSDGRRTVRQARPNSTSPTPPR